VITLPRSILPILHIMFAGSTKLDPQKDKLVKEEVEVESRNVIRAIFEMGERRLLGRKT
jgi:hypothetical protein